MKPLNVWSRSDEEIGRQLSNFAHTPFELDGVRYASVEGFYVSILVQSSTARRDKARRLWGLHAKREMPRLKPRAFDYHGRQIALGSTQHHDLVKRAIAAKLAAHPEIARAFVATAPRPIAHETGHPDPPDAEFPKETLCRILTELREECAASLASDVGACTAGQPCEPL
jgi:predicted NAD-dependent protein-ADP-ribosyltransferase YbiA (DUF1768 family)